LTLISLDAGADVAHCGAEPFTQQLRPFHRLVAENQTEVTVRDFPAPAGHGCRRDAALQQGPRNVRLATGRMLLCTLRRRGTFRVIVIYRQEVSPMNAVPAMGAPLQSTIARQN
jgi:hypothetical protein